MQQLLEMAKSRSIPVVEDAAHAFPTTINGKLIGTLDSSCTVFSFYATKTIATGEGGMLVTRDRDLARRATVMRLHGIDRDAFDRYSATRPSWYYEVVAPGFKYNMTDIAASIGIHQLRKADAFHRRRALLAQRYRDELAGLALVMPPEAPAGSKHAWHLFVVKLGEGARRSRDEVIDELYARGIGCSVHYVPLHLQPYWRDRYGLIPEQFPNSQRLFERCISLPLYTRMSDDDQTRVIGALRTILG
jgi:dTDP-4-amino-4,6-dideoxygalactose transaminase